MEKKKCLVIQNFKGYYIEEAIDIVAKKKGISLDIKLIQESIKNIPRGYDLYFIHLNDILNKEDLVKLAEEQPESYFVKLGTEGGYFVGRKRIFNEMQGILTYEEIDEILKESLI